MRQKLRSGKSGLSAMLLCAVWLAGCADGDIGLPAALPGRPPPGPFGAAGSGAVPNAAVDAAMRAANPDLFETAQHYFPSTGESAGPSRLFRLTRNQLETTTRAILPQHVKSSLADSMPRDPLQTNYEYSANLSFNAANFTPYTRWLDELSASVRAAPASVIDCAAGATSCFKERSEKFVQSAFRGLGDAALLQRYSSFFQTSAAEVGLADATADLVALALSSPHFVFRDEVPAGGTPLSPAQQLQNLTYTLADAPPSALGLAYESAPMYLGDAAALQRTLDQLLKTPQAREKLLRFFTAWLEVKEPAEFGIAPDVFPEFTLAVATAVVEQTRGFLQAQLAAAAPKLKSVTQSREAFVSDALADLYGAKRSGGTAALDPSQRFGILTQPGVIASHSGPTTTRLIKRGVFFTRKVMCLPLGLPPPGVNTTLPVMQGATERERVESATANAPCSGCHTMINPFGFMQENYDAIGRWRTTDQGKPINASVRIDVLDEGPLMAATPVAALEGLTNSLRFQQCFARQLFRFYMGREETPGDDPLLREMFFAFADKGEQDILGMLQTLVRAGSFTRREEAGP
jgi:hypothetical protein